MPDTILSDLPDTYLPYSRDTSIYHISVAGKRPESDAMASRPKNEPSHQGDELPIL